MTIDLMTQQARNAKYPLFNEAQTEQIGWLEADHNGYLKADSDELNENEGSFEQFDETDGEEKFAVCY